MRYTGLARVVLVVGGVLLGGSEALSRVPAEQPRSGQGAEGAARCRCSSAADCTCKKGECKCKNCKPRRQAREQASAGQPEATAPASPP